jgi:hypothetical protein
MPHDLYRSMKALEDGLPDVDESSRTLGARRGSDIASNEDGVIEAGAGGMSISTSPWKLPMHRRPGEFGGNGADPLFVLREQDLGPTLTVRLDDKGPSSHGFVEPVRTMTFDEYQAAIWATRRSWKRLDE